MLPAVEVESDAVVKQRPPCRRINLTLHDPRHSVVGRPAVQKVPISREAFTERTQEPGRQPRLPERIANRLQLVAAVAAVLLALAAHAVDAGLLCAVVHRVDAGVEEPLEV